MCGGWEHRGKQEGKIEPRKRQGRHWGVHEPWRELMRWARNREGREEVRQKWSGTWACILLSCCSGRLSDLRPRVRVLGQPHLGADWWRLLMCDAHQWEGFSWNCLRKCLCSYNPRKKAQRNREMIKKCYCSPGRIIILTIGIEMLLP